jgi:Tfp pilus assembly protein PilF
MILPEDRYSFSGKKRQSRKPLVIILVSAVLVLALAAAVFFIIKTPEGKIFFADPDEEITIEVLWEKQHYDTINEKCETILIDDPMNQKALVYNGFSYFYRGVSQFSLEEKIPLYDNALINLRRALLVCNDDIKGKVKYIIGKSYFQKGKFYTDLAIKYLEESMEDGYTGEDTFEYLGLLFSRLGKYEQSIEYYLKAIEEKPSDMLYLVLAQTYYQLGDKKSAEEYLIWSLNKTEDYSVEQKARYLLGNILFENGEYLKAEEEYLKIIEKNDKAADAYFYLGNIYEKLGDIAKARFEWRKCLEIDSYHYGARLKLYG